MPKENAGSLDVPGSAKGLWPGKLSEELLSRVLGGADAFGVEGFVEVEGKEERY